MQKSISRCGLTLFTIHLEKRKGCTVDQRLVCLVFACGKKTKIRHLFGFLTKFGTNLKTINLLRIIFYKRRVWNIAKLTNEEFRLTAIESNIRNWNLKPKIKLARLREAVRASHLP